MNLVRVGVGLFALLLVTGSLVVAQEKTKGKGQLPPNWSKLGLSDEQKSKIYSIRADYKGKIEALEAQVKQLKEQEGSELAKILTQPQKDRLKEIVAAKSLVEPDKKDEKKEEKKEDKK